MPFLDSETIRPLYDVVDGGPPEAFKCKVCFDVTKTLSGMVSHQFLKHGIRQQESFKFDDLPNKTEIRDERTTAA